MKGSVKYFIWKKIELSAFFAYVKASAKDWQVLYYCFSIENADTNTFMDSPLGSLPLLSKYGDQHALHVVHHPIFAANSTDAVYSNAQCPFAKPEVIEVNKCTGTTQRKPPVFVRTRVTHAMRGKHVSAEIETESVALQPKVFPSPPLTSKEIYRLKTSWSTTIETYCNLKEAGVDTFIRWFSFSQCISKSNVVGGKTASFVSNPGIIFFRVLH